MNPVQHRYLESMGIQRWVLRARGGQPGIVENKPSARQDDTVSIRAAPQRRDTPPEGESPREEAISRVEAPRFNVVFAQYKGLLLIFDVDFNAGSLTGGQQQFIADIGMALAREHVRTTNLKWPMVDSDRVRQDAASARQVLMAHFLRGLKTGDRIVLFGDAVRHHLNFSDEGLQTYATCEVEGHEALVVEGLARYMQEPMLKKDLWNALKVLL